jgi:hypothetical protein
VRMVLEHGPDHASQWCKTACKTFQIPGVNSVP